MRFAQGQMKDGRYHFKHKAENAVDLEPEVIAAAEVYHGNQGDTQTIQDTVNQAKTRSTKPRRVSAGQTRVVK